MTFSSKHQPSVLKRHFADFLHYCSMHGVTLKRSKSQLSLKLIFPGKSTSKFLQGFNPNHGTFSTLASDEIVLSVVART